MLPSIRRPKRITVRGNDEKEYRYLVKCGEDLRQDQRIEQLLDLMNGIYSRHAACRQKHLRIRTYQVVPMTPRCDVQLYVCCHALLMNIFYNVSVSPYTLHFIYRMWLENLATKTAISGKPLGLIMTRLRAGQVFTKLEVKVVILSLCYKFVLKFRIFAEFLHKQASAEKWVRSVSVCP